MSIQDSQILTVRLYALQRTVERLSHHVSDLQSQLAQTQESNRPTKLWPLFLWQRFAGRRVQATMKPRVRENRRLDHAHHAI